MLCQGVLSRSKCYGISTTYKTTLHVTGRLYGKWWGCTSSPDSYILTHPLYLPTKPHADSHRITLTHTLTHTDSHTDSH